MQSNIIAPYILRSYIWEVLKKNLDMSDDDYDVDGDGKGYIPIVPLGEEPELEDFDKAYMVYGYAESPTTQTITAGNLMIVIYATSFRELSEVANTIMKTFESDWTVDEVNKYSSTINGFIGLRFGNIKATTLTGGEPREEAGGRISTTVNIRYDYIGTYNIDTKLAAWNGTAYVRIP